MTVYISTDNPIVGEGDGFVEFHVTLSAPAPQPVSIVYSTSFGTAGDGLRGQSLDYDPTSDTLVFAPGETARTIRIPIHDDSIAEPLESVFLNLFQDSRVAGFDPTAAMIVNQTPVATIVDNDRLADTTHKASLSVRDVTVDASIGLATFAILLDRAVPDDFIVAYATADESAHAGSDYVPASGTLHFARGEVVKMVSVKLSASTSATPQKWFDLDLGSVDGSGAGMVKIGDGVGQGIIGAHGQPSVAQPILSISNPIASESDGYFDFVLSLNAPSQLPIRVQWNSPGGAVHSNDFNAPNSSMVFAPGVTTMTARIAINDNDIVDGTRYLRMTASYSSEGTVNNQLNMPIFMQAVGAVVDNDAPGDPQHKAALSVDDVTVDGAAAAVTFNVVLDKALTDGFTVSYHTADVTAHAGSEYVSTSGQLAFAPGETAGTISIPLLPGSGAEPAELFNLVLGAVAGDAAGAVAIARGTAAASLGAHGGATAALPSLSVSDVIVGEKAGLAEFVVRLSAPSDKTVSVMCNTSDGTATVGSTTRAADYEPVDETLVFAPGETLKVVPVHIIADTLAEPPETFVLGLANFENATIAKRIGVATVLDQIVGGPGLDTTAFTGTHAQYSVAATPQGVTVTDKTTGGAQLLTGVERIHFSDENIAFDVQPGGAAGQAYRIYQAALNRTPDAAGLGYWIAALDHGAPLTDVAAGFMSSAEFVKAYGANLNNHDLVSQIYLNVLHRPAEPAGLAYWVGLLDTQVIDAAEALAAISESHENQGAMGAVIGNGFSYVPFG